MDDLDPELVELRVPSCASSGGPHRRHVLLVPALERLVVGQDENLVVSDVARPTLESTYHGIRLFVPRIPAVPLSSRQLPAQESDGYAGAWLDVLQLRLSIDARKLLQRRTDCILGCVGFEDERLPRVDVVQLEVRHKCLLQPFERRQLLLRPAQLVLAPRFAQLPRQLELVLQRGCKLREHPHVRRVVVAQAEKCAEGGHGRRWLPVLHCCQLAGGRRALAASQHVSAELHTPHDQLRLGLVGDPLVLPQLREHAAQVFSVAADEVFVGHPGLALRPHDDVVEIWRRRVADCCARGVDVALQQRRPDIDALRHHSPLPKSTRQLNAGDPPAFLVQGDLVEGVPQVDGAEHLARCHLRRDVLGERQRVAVLVDHLVGDGVVAHASPLAGLLLDRKRRRPPWSSARFNFPIAPPLRLQLLQRLEPLAREVDGAAHDGDGVGLQVELRLPVLSTFWRVREDAIPEDSALELLLDLPPQVRCEIAWELVLRHDHAADELHFQRLVQLLQEQCCLLNRGLVFDRFRHLLSRLWVDLRDERELHLLDL